MQHETILDAAEANATGKSVYVQNFRDINVSISTSDSANGTIKFYISLNEESPTFSSAAAVDNEYDTIEILDLQDQSSAIAGDTGVAFSGTDDVRNFSVNCDGGGWVTAKLSSRSAGKFTVKAAISNQTK